MNEKKEFSLSSMKTNRIIFTNKCEPRAKLALSYTMIENRIVFLFFTKLRTIHNLQYTETQFPHRN